MGVYEPCRSADCIRKTALVVVIGFFQIIFATDPPGFPGAQHGCLAADESVFKSGQVADQIVCHMPHHLTAKYHGFAVGNRIGGAEPYRDLRTVHAHNAFFADDGIGLHVFCFFLCQFTCFYTAGHQRFQFVPLGTVHGFCNFKIGRLRLTPVFLEILDDVTAEAFYIDPAHFKPEGKGLVIARLFIAALTGNTGRTGQKGISCSVDKDSGTDSGKSRDGLHNAGCDDGTGAEGVNQYCLIQNFHTCFFTHFIVDQGQGLRIMPGLPGDSVRVCDSVFLQPFFYFCHVRRVAVRRMGIHERVYAT